jgi:hypothetical protein
VRGRGGGTLERLEATPAGRALISVGLILTITGMVVVNMPNSNLKRDVGRLTQPYVNAAGLDQNWAVYSDPRTLSAYVTAHIDYADGSSSVLRIPMRTGPGAFVDYRWQKYEEQMRPDTGQWLWAPYADYLAAHARAEGRQPVRVSLVRRWADSNAPGPGPDRGPWHEFTFYVETVAATG